MSNLHPLRPLHPSGPVFSPATAGAAIQGGVVSAPATAAPTIVSGGREKPMGGSPGVIQSALTSLSPADGIPSRFTGRAWEYFPIWIVNLVLSVLTIGIWSAWAKVRRLRFFYGNTVIADSTLDYIAKPMQLLLGRLIVFGIIGVSYVLAIAAPAGAVLFTLALLPLIPWVINRSIIFNARMTVWRNVRFDFSPSYKGALWAHVVLPVLAVVGLGWLKPFVTRAQVRFFVNRHLLGQAKFHTEPSIADYYIVFIWSLLVFFGVLLATVLLLVLLLVPLFTIGGLSSGDEISYLFSDIFDVENAADPAMAVLIIYGLLFTIFPALIASQSYYREAVRALIYNHLVLEDGHRFRSTLSGFRYTWIVFSNTLVVMCTLGLATPWAAVRAWRYQCETLSVHPAGSLDDFVSANDNAGSAFGSEYADIDGIDLGI